MSRQQPLLPRVFALHGRWRASQPALITHDEWLDWATLDARTNQVANGLIGAGCAKGARVGVLMSNCAAMLEVMLGAMKAGAVVAPINPSVTDEAIAAMLQDAGAGALFVTSEHCARCVGELATPKLRIAVGADGAWNDYLAWREAQSPEPPDACVAADDICNIIYSSGTTGQPKGIAHSHQCRIDTAHDLAHVLRYNSAARTLIVTGLFSNISWASMLPTLLLGGTVYVRKTFEPRDVLETIARERITNVSMVPVQYQRLLEHPEFSSFYLTSMRAMMCCGAPLPVHVKEQLFERLACGVIELYGSTEGVITTLAPEEAHGRMASVGKPLPGEDIAILSDDGRILPAGQSGEVIALSRIMMSGYWANPEATAEAMWTDAAGRTWLRSGDIGRLDGEGYLYITDRKKDMIISGGQNIYPADIEAVLMRHASVLDCAVFGVPSDKWGETPLALVVLRGGAKDAAGDVRAWLNAQLGKQQRVHEVEIRPSLPRNANGKLLKRELRAPYWRAPLDGRRT
ncbi:MAG: class I adenylate-forming enzyme family protein [Hyphomonadaceae bacterium]